MKNEIFIEKNHEGRIIINTESWSKYMSMSFLLSFRHGFLRFGIWFPPIFDEGIYPSFYRFGKKIMAGYDNWSGYYLMSDNQETDSFLKEFYKKLKIK